MECVDKRTSPQECPGSSQTEQNTLKAVQSFLCIIYIMVISAILRFYKHTAKIPDQDTTSLICYESCDVGSSEATVIIIISLISLCSYLARIVGCRKCLHTEASTKENDNQVK